MVRLLYQWWRPICWFILMLITLGSLIPLAELPNVSGSDKTHHLIAYGALAMPIALRQSRGWPFLLIAALLYGGVIELIQPLANRYAEWEDFFCNGAGLVLGALVGCLLRLTQKTLI